ncbi:glycosyltransferase family 4 protein [Agromyces sp. CCNWLW203]|uniref:glycosyltransferase family 4 protein n=1 Tax=Agromyces sp. CCNWLW203 TaxID=3112842 RepID=UPI002F9677E4
MNDVTPSPTNASLRPRVAIALLTLYPGGHGGGEVYAKETVARLARDPRVDVRVHLPRNAAGWNGGVAEELAPVTSSASGLRRLLGMARVVLQSSALRRSMRGASIVHYPLTVPIPSSLRSQTSIVSIADTQHLDLPELFHPFERLFRRFAYDRAARRADAVVTISEFTKARLVHHLGIAPDRITVAHLGYDPVDFAPNLGERGDFLFYPARAWRHKNHERLFAAFALVRERHPDMRLVLSGGDLDKLGDLPQGVEWAGHVSREELGVLYRSAAALVFPSLYEGFGLPPLEAMAAGCPVAASASGSIPEICADAAVYFDPEDPTSIADGVDEALRLGSELGARGVERAATFTWEHCSDVHRALYERLARSTHEATPAG